MTPRDAAMLALDAETDALSVDVEAADELFDVVDFLESQAQLRRSLSDPAASPDERAELATRLFSSQVSATTLSVLTAVARATLSSGNRLVNALERQGIRSMLSVARRSGDLARVQQELHAFATAVDSDPNLGEALRNRATPLEARRALVTRLLDKKTHFVTDRLLARAASSRVRTLPLTVRRYLQMAADSSHQQIARVTVARPLDEARSNRLRKALEAQVGGPVWLQFEVDPSVLGGMDVQLGDDMIESTVAGRLDDARRLLTNH